MCAGSSGGTGPGSGTRLRIRPLAGSGKRCYTENTAAARRGKAFQWEARIPGERNWGVNVLKKAEHLAWVTAAVLALGGSILLSGTCVAGALAGALAGEPSVSAGLAELGLTFLFNLSALGAAAGYLAQLGMLLRAWMQRWKQP